MIPVAFSGVHTMGMFTLRNRDLPALIPHIAGPFCFIATCAGQQYRAYMPTTGTVRLYKRMPPDGCVGPHVYQEPALQTHNRIASIKRRIRQVSAARIELPSGRRVTVAVVRRLLLAIPVTETHSFSTADLTQTVPVVRLGDFQWAALGREMDLGDVLLTLGYTDQTRIRKRMV